MATGDTYVVTEHEAGKPFEPPNEDAQIVRCCGHNLRFRRITADDPNSDYEEFTTVLVLWAYPTRR
jgi:hypothetical protein